jgi:proline racemase
MTLEWAAWEQWQPPQDWLTLHTIDAHTGGEPLRIVVRGFPRLPGSTILEKRQYARTHHDDLRRALMWEPRGHADMYGAILTEPVTPDGDFGVLFIHNEGFSTMCGHGIIALVTVGVQIGFIPIQGAATTVRIDTPAGRVTATAHTPGGTLSQVSFENVPSFVLLPDYDVEVPGLGRIRCDVAFGGAFYAYVEVEQPALKGLTLVPAEHTRIIEVGRRIKQAVMASTALVHPTGDADLNFLYGTILVERSREAGLHSRNVCIFAEGEVDRSPTGTGVSGRLAIHHARGELGLGEPITISSLVGSRFTGSVARTVQVGSYAGIIPVVSGTAHITGRHIFTLDPADDLGRGFLLR